MKVRFWAGVLSGAALLAGVTAANAGTIALKVTSGAVVAQTASSATGSLSTSNTINSVNYAVTGSVTDNSGVIALNLGTTGTNTVNGARSVTYQLTATGLTAPMTVSDFQELFSGINPIKNQNSGITYTDAALKIYYDTNDVAFGTQNLVYDSGMIGNPGAACGSPSSYSCSAVGALASITAPYSLTQVLTINYHGSSQGVVATGSSSLTTSFTPLQSAAVPEPTSLAMLGSGLVLAGAMLRRRRKTASV